MSRYDPEESDNVAERFQRAGHGLFDFMMVWDGLAEQGVCPRMPDDDEEGRMPVTPAVEEYRRVFEAWKAAGCPEAIGEFIRRTVGRNT
jgi:hypothetical protein